MYRLCFTLQCEIGERTITHEVAFDNLSNAVARFHEYTAYNTVNIARFHKVWIQDEEYCYVNMTRQVSMQWCDRCFRLLGKNYATFDEIIESLGGLGTSITSDIVLAWQAFKLVEVEDNTYYRRYFYE